MNLTFKLNLCSYNMSNGIDCLVVDGVNLVDELEGILRLCSLLPLFGPSSAGKTKHIPYLII